MQAPAEKGSTATFPETQASRPAGTIARRFVSIAYELLLILAVLLFAGLLFPGATGSTLPPTNHLAFQAYLLFVIGLYLIPCWRMSGQTLPMKAWRLRVERTSGERLELWRAMLRYVLACLSTLAFGLGYAWALFDRDGQFLHDRLSRTRIVAYQ